MIICNFCGKFNIFQEKNPNKSSWKDHKTKERAKFSQKKFPPKFVSVSANQWLCVRVCVPTTHYCWLSSYFVHLNLPSRPTFSRKKTFDNGTLLAPPDVISQTVEFLSLCGKASLLRSFSVFTWKGNFFRFFCVVASFPWKILSPKINLNGDHASLICHTFIVFFSQVTRIHKRYSASQFFFLFLFTTEYIY